MPPVHYKSSTRLESDLRNVVSFRLFWPSVEFLSFSLYYYFFFVCSYNCTVGDKSEFTETRNLTQEEFQANPRINWDAIMWVSRPLELWFIQFILAVISLSETLLLTYLGYKVGGTPPRFLSYEK